VFRVPIVVAAVGVCEVMGQCRSRPNFSSWEHILEYLGDEVAVEVGGDGVGEIGVELVVSRMLDWCFIYRVHSSLVRHCRALLRALPLLLHKLLCFSHSSSKLVSFHGSAEQVSDAWPALARLKAGRGSWPSLSGQGVLTFVGTANESHVCDATKPNLHYHARAPFGVGMAHWFACGGTWRNISVHKQCTAINRGA